MRDFIWGILLPEYLGMVDSTTFSKGFAIAEWGSINQILPPFNSPDDVAIHEGYHLLGCEHSLIMTTCYYKIQRLKEAAKKERMNGGDFFPIITKEGKILRSRNEVENELYQLNFKNTSTSQAK